MKSRLFCPNAGAALSGLNATIKGLFGSSIVAISNHPQMRLGKLALFIAALASDFNYWKLRLS